MHSNHQKGLLVICLGLILYTAIHSAGGLDMRWGVASLGIGFLALMAPMTHPTPRYWLVALGLFFLFSCAGFLPVAWFGKPEWRQELETLGIAASPTVYWQWQQSLETLLWWGVAAFSCLWVLGQKRWPVVGAALGFSWMVLIYVLLSKSAQDNSNLFGFLPNRNHSSTLMAMGLFAALGTLVQGLKQKNWLLIGIASPPVLICIIGILFWNISRSGLILLPLGLLLWLALLWQSRRSWKLPVILLMVCGAVGIYLFQQESAAKDRLTTAASEAISEESGKMNVDVYRFDLRFSTWDDTLTMIGKQAFIGAGPRQFEPVFSQQRQRTSIVDKLRLRHPESDWLWLASEVGLPAFLAFLALVGMVLFSTLQQLRQGRERTIRSACFVGALLLVIHGLTDVPGHRFPLFFSGALLISIARHSSSNSIELPPPKISSRWMGIPCVVFGLYCLLPGWTDSMPILVERGTHWREEALEMFENDYRAWQAYRKNVDDSQGEAPVDNLPFAREKVKAAIAVEPLEPENWRLLGLIELQYDDRQEQALKAFEIQRALIPDSVSVCLDQMNAWKNLDREQARSLLEEAERRARRLPPNYSEEALRKIEFPAKRLVK